MADVRAVFDTAASKCRGARREIRWSRSIRCNGLSPQPGAHGDAWGSMGMAIVIEAACHWHDVLTTTAGSSDGRRAYMELIWAMNTGHNDLIP